MTDTATATIPTTEWNTAFQNLKARYPKVREPIVVALHILQQNPDIALDDAKAQAALHGARITAASVSAAQRLMSRQDGAQAPAAAKTKPAPKPATPRARRATRADTPVDIEGVVRDAVARISASGNAETERLRAAIRKAITVLEAAVGN
jgi:hypothetical protein